MRTATQPRQTHLVSQAQRLLAGDVKPKCQAVFVQPLNLKLHVGEQLR